MESNTIEEYNDIFDIDIPSSLPIKVNKIHNGKTKEDIALLTSKQKEKRRKKTRDKAKAKKIHISNQHKENTAQLTQEEKVAYYKQLKQNKKLQADLIANSIHSQMKIVFDLNFITYMKHNEIKSLALQLTNSYRVNKDNKTKLCYYFTSFTGIIKEELEKMGSANWHCKFYKEDFLNVEELNTLGRTVVYLSPDSDEDLEDVNEDCIYVIGGLVDRSVLKNKSLDKVQKIIGNDNGEDYDEKVSIVTKRLPLKKYINNIKKVVLNINTVVEILSKYIDCKDWKEAILSSLPMRMKNN